MQNPLLQGTVGITIGEFGHRVLCLIDSYFFDSDSFSGTEMNWDQQSGNAITIWHPGSNGLREWDASNPLVQNGQLFIPGGSDQGKIDSFIAYMTARDSGALAPGGETTTPTGTGPDSTTGN